MEKKKILIVDDHELVRSGLRQLIETQPNLSICNAVASVSEAKKSLKTCTPDMAIIDLSLPDGHGLDLIKYMKSKYPEIIILVFSMHNPQLFAKRAILYGAKGFLCKEEANEKVIEVIHYLFEKKTGLCFPRIRQ